MPEYRPEVEFPTEIPTDRLLLRRVQSSDVSSLVALLEDGPSRLFLGGPLNREVAVERADGMIDANGAWVLLAVGGGRAVGLLTLAEHDLGLELSYQLFAAWWGKGLAAEAAAAVLEAVREGNSPRIVAVTQKANRKSRKLLERLGFHEEDEYTEYGEVQLLYVLPAHGASG